VMKKISDGQRDTLECTGSYRRDATSAVNNVGFRALSGKILNLKPFSAVRLLSPLPSPFGPSWENSPSGKWQTRRTLADDL